MQQKELADHGAGGTLDVGEIQKQAGLRALELFGDERVDGLQIERIEKAAAEKAEHHDLVGL
jgi:hypothetical protein